MARTPISSAGRARWSASTTTTSCPGSLRPAPRVDPSAAWEAFSQAQRGVVELTRATAGLAPASVRFRNPIAFDLPVFDLATGLLIIAAHERRHLLQLDRLKARPGFPAD